MSSGLISDLDALAVKAHPEADVSDDDWAVAKAKFVDALWLHWPVLRDRLRALEARVAELEAQCPYGNINLQGRLNTALNEVERLRAEVREEREVTVFRVKDWKWRVTEVEAENAKLRRVVEAARAAYGATVDEDAGEGDGLYVCWREVLALGEALAALDAEAEDESKSPSVSTPQGSTCDRPYTRTKQE